MTTPQNQSKSGSTILELFEATTNQSGYHRIRIDNMEHILPTLNWCRQFKGMEKEVQGKHKLVIEIYGDGFIGTIMQYHEVTIMGNSEIPEIYFMWKPIWKCFMQKNEMSELLDWCMIQETKVEIQLKSSLNGKVKTVTFGVN